MCVCGDEVGIMNVWHVAGPTTCNSGEKLIYVVRACCICALA